MDALDKFDLAILRELQIDARLTNAELAQRVGLSAAPCWRRVKALEEEKLLGIKWDFNWQITYQLKEARRLPKGTRIDVVAHYDNSAQNKFNPDPTKDVRWGDQTWEEMMIGFYGTTREVVVGRAGN